MDTGWSAGSTSRPNMAESLFSKPPFKRSESDSGEVGPVTRSQVVVEGVLIHLAVFIGVIVSAFIAMRLISLPPTNVTVVWLPAGIALLALRTPQGWACVPTIALAHWAVIALANNYGFFSFRPWSYGMALANTAGPMIGAAIWKRWVRGDPFGDPFAFVRFTFGVAFLPSALTAWAIPAIIAAAGHLPGATLSELAMRITSITLSSTLGVFLLVPVVLASWSGGLLRKIAPLATAHLVNAITALTIAWLGFNHSPTWLYLCIPIAFVTAVLCGSRGLGISLFIFTFYGLLATAKGLGPFAGTGFLPVASLFQVAAATLCLGIPAHFTGLTLLELTRHREELETIITDRTRALQASEERYRLANDVVSVGVFEWEDGRITPFVNRVLQRKVGHVIRDDGLTWGDIWRVVHPTDRKALASSIKAFMKGDADVFCLDGRMRLRSGQWSWFQARGRVFARDARGRARRIVGTFCDVDEEKHRLLELSAAREKADARTKARDAFLASISHEIRTPMHAMLGFARMLEGSSLDAKQAECVDAIVTSGDLLLELLNDLLDISRIEAGVIELDPDANDLAALARQTARLFEPEATQKHVALSVTIEPDLPRLLMFDAGRVRQVIANLISNAVKFTERGSVEVRISAEPIVNRPAADPAPSWRVRIEVLDTGIGIDPEHLDRLFNPFSQADSSIRKRFGGTGLGLAISRRLCELMGGTISVTSKSARGSVFTATFMAPGVAAVPAGDDRTDASTKEPRTDARERRLHVLVVEDDRLNRRLADMMLQRLGHKTSFAHHGVQALELLAENTFDVVFMDVEMPEMDGLTATREWRKREAAAGSGVRLPIIAVTAHAGGDERSRCLAAGVDDYLTKPLDLATIRETLAQVRHPSGSTNTS